MGKYFPLLWVNHNVPKFMVADETETQTTKQRAKNCAFIFLKRIDFRGCDIFKRIYCLTFGVGAKLSLVAERQCHSSYMPSCCSLSLDGDFHLEELLFKISAKFPHVIAN